MHPLRLDGLSRSDRALEVMPVTEDLRSMILNRQGHGDIVGAATARGTRTLAQDGVEKVRQGFTSLVEVSRVTATL